MKKQHLNCPQNTLIVLYGKKNSGKTTTLIHLLELLANNDQSILTDIKRNFYNKRGRALDARIVVEYCNKLILISTFGDSWLFSRLNTNFFEYAIDSKAILYVMDSKGVRQLTADDFVKRFNNKTPDYCICACRPEGDNFGAMKAYLSYMEKSAYKYSKILWIRKNDKDVEPSTVTAQKLIEIIKDSTIDTL